MARRVSRIKDRGSKFEKSDSPGTYIFTSLSSILAPQSSIFLLPSAKHRSGRTLTAVLGFLLLFAILIVMVSQWYLLPTLAAFNNAGKPEKKEIAAYARLLLTVLLVILLIGLMLTFRIGRFFFPRPGEPRVKTKYVDAWAEAGKRLGESEDDPG